MLPKPKPKPLSSCCERPAKLNMNAGEGDPLFFCDHCGEPCELSQRRAPFKASTISKVRKPSGEMEVFKELYAECGGRSVISGDPLLPPGHKMFHWQMAHVCPKGNYPELRLDKSNIFPVTVDEHHYQTTQPKKCQEDPLWAKFWKRHAELKLKAETKNLSR